MLDLNTLILAVAAILFVIAIGALLVWAFRTFFGGGTSSHGFLRSRDRRLGVVETASVDQRRKLILIRRDDVEHLIMIGGPVDMVVETSIRGRPHLEPPLEDVNKHSELTAALCSWGRRLRRRR
jgi:flagellar protein FliO/FliZ